MLSTTIPNRLGLNLAIVIDPAPHARGVAFVLHGLSGFKEQPHIVAAAQALNHHGFTVVRYDGSNSFGEGGGRIEDATPTTFIHDLEDVLAWAKSQVWFAGQLVLCGHSMGGLAVALYAEQHPQEVFAVAPMAPVVSGKLCRETYSKEDLEKWQTTGWREDYSKSKPGRLRRLPWSHQEDRMRYDLVPLAGNLKMPALIIVGEKDEVCPPRHQQIFLDAIPAGKKELAIIPGAPHTSRDPEQIAAIARVLGEWAGRL